MSMKRVVLYCAISSSRPSRILRLAAASDYAGVPADSFTEDVLAHGKPYFPSHPNVRFSVSHSGNIWICAFSDTEVGADVQVYQKNDSPDRRKRIAKRWFSQGELRYLEKHDFAESEFYKIWARKEAYVKLTGDGIGHGSFPSFDTTETQSPCIFHDIVLSNADEPHSLAIACTDEFETEIRPIFP